MDTKICCECQRELALTEENFSRNKANKDGFVGTCKPCRNEKRKQWRANYKEKHGEPESRRYNESHREQYAKVSFIRIQKNKAIIDQLKEETPCSDCGNKFPAVCMDFDHVQGEKLGSVCWLVNQGASLDKIMEEIEKCELVCANCHRIRTHTSGRERPWYDMRRKYDRVSWVYCAPVDTPEGIGCSDSSKEVHGITCSEPDSQGF